MIHNGAVEYRGNVGAMYVLGRDALGSLVQCLRPARVVIESRLTKLLDIMFARTSGYLSRTCDCSFGGEYKIPFVDHYATRSRPVENSLNSSPFREIKYHLYLAYIETYRDYT
jgi:hypothetical protein